MRWGLSCCILRAEPKSGNAGTVSERGGNADVLFERAVEAVDSRGLVSVLFDDGDLDYDVDLASIFAMPAAPSPDATLHPKTEGAAHGDVRDASSDLGAREGMAIGRVKGQEQDGKGREERAYLEERGQCRLGQGAPKKRAGVRANAGKRGPGVSKLGALENKFKCPTCGKDFSAFHPKARAGCAAKHRRACALSFGVGGGRADGKGQGKGVRQGDCEGSQARQRTCHLCSHLNRDVSGMRPCGWCPRSFCERCLDLHVLEGNAALGEREPPAGLWLCPVCNGTCCCCAPSSAPPCSQSHRHCGTYRSRRKRLDQHKHQSPSGKHKSPSALASRLPVFKKRRPLTTEGLRKKKHKMKHVGAAACRILF